MTESLAGEKLSPELDSLSTQLEALVQELPIRFDSINYNQFDDRTGQDGCRYGISKSVDPAGGGHYAVTREFPVDADGMVRRLSLCWGDDKPTAHYTIFTDSRKYQSSPDPDAVYRFCPMEEADIQRAQEIITAYESLGAIQ